MNYLFFDCECANNYNGEAKICSLGYVLTDDNLNIIESDDIFINPNTEWDEKVLKKILAYPKEKYESGNTFNIEYNRIKNLFTNVIVFAHAATNDVGFIVDECKRYNLPQIEYNYYDSSIIFRIYSEGKKIYSLDKISEALGCKRQSEKHTSLEDAFLVYEQVKTMCSNLNCNLKELLSKFKLNMNNSRKHSKNKVKKDSSENIETYNSVLDWFITECRPKSKRGDRKLKGDVIALPTKYINQFTKNTIYLVQLVRDAGARLTRDISEANIYVTHGDNTLNQLLGNGYALVNGDKTLKIITLEELYQLVGYNYSLVNSFYKDIYKEYNDSLNKKEYIIKSDFNNNIGSLFSELLEEFK